MDDSVRAQIILAVRNEGLNNVKAISDSVDTLVKKMKEAGDAGGAKSFKQLSSALKETSKDLQGVNRPLDQLRTGLGSVGKAFQWLGGVAGTALGILGGFSLFSFLSQSIQLWQTYEKTVTTVAMRVASASQNAAGALKGAILDQERASASAGKYLYTKTESAAAQESYARASGQSIGRGMSPMAMYARAMGADLPSLAGQVGGMQFMFGAGSGTTGYFLSLLRGMAQKTGMGGRTEEYISATQGLMSSLQSQNPFLRPETALGLQGLLGDNPAWRGARGAQIISSMSGAVAGGFGDPRKQAFYLRSGLEPLDILRGLSKEGNLEKISGGVKREFGTGKTGELAVRQLLGFENVGLGDAAVSIMKKVWSGGKVTEADMKKMSAGADEETNRLVKAFNQTDISKRLENSVRVQEMQLEAGHVLNDLQTQLINVAIQMAGTMKSVDFAGMAKSIMDSIPPMARTVTDIVGPAISWIAQTFGFSKEVMAAEAQVKPGKTSFFENLKFKEKTELANVNRLKMELGEMQASGASYRVIGEKEEELSGARTALVNTRRAIQNYDKTTSYQGFPMKEGLKYAASQIEGILGKSIQITSSTGGKHVSGSAHYEGRALDFTVPGLMPDSTEAERAGNLLQSKLPGVKVINEYLKKNWSPATSGYHFHIEEMAAAKAAAMGTIPKAYLPSILKYSKLFGVNPSVLAGIINKESGWNPNAKGSSGEIGLGQIMPETAAGIAGDLGVKKFDLKDPETNIKFAAYYFSKQLSRYKGDVKKALSAYNAGTAYGGNIEYVNDVVRRSGSYQRYNKSSSNFQGYLDVVRPGHSSIGAGGVSVTVNYRGADRPNEAVLKKEITTAINQALARFERKQYEAYHSHLKPFERGAYAG